jgi:hypothetical protein
MPRRGEQLARLGLGCGAFLGCRRAGRVGGEVVA